MGQHISQVFAPGHPPTIVPPVGAPGFGAGKPPTIPHLPTTKQNSNPTNQNTPPPHTSTTPTPDAPNPPPDPTSTTAATEASPPADPSPPGNSIPPADSIVPTSTLITGGATSVAPLSAADSSAASDGNTESSQIPLLNEPQSSRGSTSNGAGDSGTTAPLSPFPTGTQTTTLSDGIVTTETQYGTPSGASTTPIPSIQSASSASHVNTTAIVAGVLVPLLLLFLACAGYLLYRRRRRLRDRREWERTHEEIAEAVRQVGPAPPIGAWARLDNASQGDLEFHGERTPNHGDTYPFRFDKGLG